MRAQFAGVLTFAPDGNNMSSRQIGRRGNSPNVDARGFSSKYTWKSHS